MADGNDEWLILNRVKMHCDEWVIPSDRENDDSVRNGREGDDDDDVDGGDDGDGGSVGDGDGDDDEYDDENCEEIMTNSIKGLGPLQREAWRKWCYCGLKPSLANICKKFLIINIKLPVF